MKNSSTAHIEYALASAFLEKLETDIKDTDLLHLEESFQDFLLSLARRSFGTIIEELDSRVRPQKGSGLRLHEKRKRTLGTCVGDISFRRCVYKDRTGTLYYPLDAFLDIGRGERISPLLQERVSLCALKSSYRTAIETLCLQGASHMSAKTAQKNLCEQAQKLAEEQRAAARRLFNTGDMPPAPLSSEELYVEADGTYIRMRDGSTKEVKASVAYSAKQREGKRTKRLNCVHFACVGETPEAFWKQSVASVGSLFD